MDELENISRKFWALDVQYVQLIAARENQVFQVNCPNDRYVLKIARPGYHTEATLKSEMDFLSYLSANDFPIAKPIRTLNGEWHVATSMGFASLQVWVDGRPIGENGMPINISNVKEIFQKLGRSMAELHVLGKNWSRPDDFERPDWGCDGLVGDNPVWGRFWSNPLLNELERKEFQEFRDYAYDELKGKNTTLIHADLVKENFLINGNQLTLIDFDDFGTGFELFEIATTLVKCDQESEFETIKSSLCSGYNEILDLDFGNLELFMAIRAASYLGWIATRRELDPNGRKTANYRDRALEYIRKLKGNK